MDALLLPAGRRPGAWGLQDESLGPCGQITFAAGETLGTGLEAVDPSRSARKDALTEAADVSANVDDYRIRRIRPGNYREWAARLPTLAAKAPGIHGRVARGDGSGSRGSTAASHRALPRARAGRESGAESLTSPDRGPPRHRSSPHTTRTKPVAHACLTACRS